MTRFSKHLILPLLATLLVVCGCHKDKNVFKLEGNLRNIPGDELYLFGTQPPFDHIDTIRPEEGRFTYETPMDTVNLLTLLFADGNTLPLFADKNLTVSLNGDMQHHDSILLSGGALNEELNLFMQQARALNDSAQIVAQADSFIRSHPFSQVSIYLLDRYFIQTRQPDYAQIQSLTESMSGLLHDHPLVQAVQEKAANAKKAEVGRNISSFRFRDLKGKNLTSYSYRDKLLLILFWATWNDESVAMQQQLKALQKKLKKEDIAFVYFSLDTDKKRWRETVENDTLSGDHVCDGEGWESNTVKQFAIEDVPTAVLLTVQRKIVDKGTDIEALSAKADSLLKEEKIRKSKLKKK